jgi:hypothetical protein
MSAVVRPRCGLLLKASSDRFFLRRQTRFDFGPGHVDAERFGLRHQKILRDEIAQQVQLGRHRLFVRRRRGQVDDAPIGLLDVIALDFPAVDDGPASGAHGEPRRA